MGGGIELPTIGGVPLPSDSREARCFALEELAIATRNFTDINLIGVGKFGEVHKGLLHDGMIVAIKKRPGARSQEFVNEVTTHFILQMVMEESCTLQIYTWITKSD